MKKIERSIQTDLKLGKFSSSICNGRMTITKEGGRNFDYDIMDLNSSDEIDEVIAILTESKNVLFKASNS